VVDLSFIDSGLHQTVSQVGRDWERVSTYAGKSIKEWYCFGHKLLSLECEDQPFSTRFREIYAECKINPPPLGSNQHVELRVMAVPSDPNVLAVSMSPNRSDGAAFLRQLVPYRRYLEITGFVPGWKLLAMQEAPDEPVFAFGPDGMLISRRHPWQHAVALYAISSTFRLQPDVYVLHAASVGVSGRGVLLSGAKGAGKSTLSLAFASRGHAFLGDEWAAVSSLNGKLLPLRRAASIRPGPHPAGLDECLRRNACDTEMLPDGTRRTRALVGTVFPRANSNATPLTDIFFLRRFAERPAVERATPSRDALPPVAPLLASVWGHSPGERAFHLFRTLGKARWWHLDVGGSPDETADLIERTLKEEIWD
jgi:hypothetical protein